MRNHNIHAGMTLEYRNGSGPRLVEIIDTRAVPGPGSGVPRVGRDPITQKHPMWIAARFLDTNEVARVSTRGLSKIAGPPAPPQLELPVPVAPAPASGVELKFVITFSVPVAKAGIIETVLSLLEGEGRVSLEATTIEPKRPT